MIRIQKWMALMTGLVVLGTLMVLLRDNNRPFVPNATPFTPGTAANVDQANIAKPPPVPSAAQAQAEKVNQELKNGVVDVDEGKKVAEAIADAELNQQLPPKLPEKALEDAERAQEKGEKVPENVVSDAKTKKPDLTQVAGSTGALKYFKLVQDPDNQPKDGKVRAAFVTLARNLDLYSLITSIKGVEDRFNHRYHYDWVFLNDEEFSDEFKKITLSIISGKTKYGVIPKEHWLYPTFIDQQKAAEVRQKMKEDKIIYGDLELYRHMCRFELGFFWRNPLMDEYDWYWRVEPDTTIYCDLEYDLFKYMQDNNKVYGFTISIHEFEKTIKTLWKTLMLFVKEHPDYIADDNSMDFISDNNGETYNLCHYWSNFEIANLNFWRLQPYVDYFEHLDKAGGFFYERWGDAPIHSIAASLFLPKDKIHYFEDVGYRHGVYTQCPVDSDYRAKHKCYCDPSKDFTFRGYSCGKKWHDVFDHPKMKGWEDFQS